MGTGSKLCTMAMLVLAYQSSICVALIDEDGCESLPSENLTELCSIDFIDEACPDLCGDPQEEQSLAELLEKSAVVVAFPVVAMMLGSLVALLKTPSDTVKIVCSGSAAGILIGAVALEFFPIMAEEQADWYAAPLGLAIGTAVFIILSRILPDGEDEEDDADSKEIGYTDAGEGRSGRTSNPTFSTVSATTPLLADTTYLEKVDENDLHNKLTVPSAELLVCTGEACINHESDSFVEDIEDLISAKGLSGSLKAAVTGCVGACSQGPNVVLRRLPTEGTPRTHHHVSKDSLSTLVANAQDDVRDTLDPEALTTGSCARIPWIRVMAISLDGAIDGTLLGIASSIGEKEAILIAAAMTIEMCFVGVSLSTSLKKLSLPFFTSALIVIMTPLSMYVGLALGAYALHDVDQKSDIFIGVISFGAAALLYLALIELIPEVFEIGEDAGLERTKEVVTMSVFGGLILVLILSESIPLE